MRSHFPEYIDNRPIVPFKSTDWRADSSTGVQRHLLNATIHKYRN